MVSGASYQYSNADSGTKITGGFGLWCCRLVAPALFGGNKASRPRLGDPVRGPVARRCGEWSGATTRARSLVWPILHVGVKCRGHDLAVAPGLHPDAIAP